LQLGRFAHAVSAGLCARRFPGMGRTHPLSDSAPMSLGLSPMAVLSAYEHCRGARGRSAQVDGHLSRYQASLSRCGRGGRASSHLA
jgi:hypothetical protein